MYIDLIVIIVLLILVLVVFRKFSSFVYAMAIIDIFLRILTFIKYNTVKELKDLIARFFPESIPSIIRHYTNGILCDLIIWAYVIVFIIFLGYITSYFIRKRK